MEQPIKSRRALSSATVECTGVVVSDASERLVVQGFAASERVAKCVAYTSSYLFWVTLLALSAAILMI